MDQIQEQLDIFAKKIVELKDQLSIEIEARKKLEDIILFHQHSGLDGTSNLLAGYIKLPTGGQLQIGSTALQDARRDTSGITLSAWIVGDDNDETNGSDNSQLVIQHGQAIGSSTFIIGQRQPLFTGTDGNISVGGTTMTQSTYSWTTNALANAYVFVYTSATEFDFFQIASNTASQITITGGTWSASANPANWTVFQPIYIGGSQYPFQRFYTMESTSGGVRFGGGDTNGGQNGLLYMDSTGDLYWRNKAGASTKLN